ncbi:MAG: ABC transporter substrate-binding protein, partial [Candidatus Binatia bacterium]
MMKNRKKLYSGIVLGLLVSIGCFSPAQADSSFYAKAKEEGKIVLYTSLAGSDTKPFEGAFEKKYPGVQLEIYRASGSKVLQKILTENRAGTDIADAVMTQGNALYVLREKNLLAKFDSPERKAFDSRFKDKEGYWTDVYPTVHSIVYNTKAVARRDLPAHYTDLADPKWQGKVGLNRNNFMFLAAMLHLYGKEKGMDFLRKLAKQNPQVRAGGTLTATLVGAGEFPIAYSVNANNVENVKEKGSPVDWVRVEDPLYGEPHPAAVMAGAAHPNAARLVVEFAISKEGQSLISKLGKVPARGDIQPKIGVDRTKLRIIPPEEEARTA